MNTQNKNMAGENKKWRESNARALAGIPAVALTQFSVKSDELHMR
jgi:hypothetical protein